MYLSLVLAGLGLLPARQSFLRVVLASSPGPSLGASGQKKELYYGSSKAGASILAPIVLADMGYSPGGKVPS